jgi:hypothetical protein
MRAIIYDRASPEGVKMAEAPQPALAQVSSSRVMGRQYVVCRVHGAGVNLVDA